MDTAVDLEPGSMSFTWKSQNVTTTPRYIEETTHTPRDQRGRHYGENYGQKCLSAGHVDRAACATSFNYVSAL